jgi:hypothetical protein
MTRTGVQAGTRDRKRGRTPRKGCQDRRSETVTEILKNTKAGCQGQGLGTGNKGRSIRNIEPGSGEQRQRQENQVKNPKTRDTREKIRARIQDHERKPGTVKQGQRLRTGD